MKKLFVVTNRSLILRESMKSVIDEAALGGVDAVILREKDLNSNELLDLAKDIKSGTDLRNIPLIINSNIDVAVEINAWGFHTNYRSFMDNNILYKGINGVSVHTVNEAVEAERKGADYLLAGHVFRTDCKKGLEGRGISFISEICKNVSIPVIAIGGICKFNVSEVLKAGASGVAVMSSVMSAEDPFDIVQNLKKAF